jgi:adenosine deaminase
VLTASTARLRRLPKAELHVHLDGSLRPETMLDLARERGVSLPVATADELAEHMLVSDASNLEEYLERFRLTLSVMQDAEAMERIAYELAVDHTEEGVVYLEVRFCPALNANGELEPGEAIEAALRGLSRAESEREIETRVIVCALRTLPRASSMAMAELAVRYADRGVSGFDLAGAEAGNPVEDHLDAFRIADEGGLPITIHAGEGFGSPSIRQAIELGGARRIGHGTRLYEDPELLACVRDRQIPLEMCLTSNVQTRVTNSHAEHPFRSYFDQGLAVCLCTDNRLMSGVDLTTEYEIARDDLGFSWDELVTVARSGFEHAFVPDEVKRELLATFEERIRRID